MSVQAYEWTINIGTPATLVAGAALATLLETSLSQGLKLDPTDPHWLRATKKACVLLLLLAFGTEICVVFMSTVLGTVLLTGGSADPGTGGQRWGSFNPVADSAMGLLHREMEFEYLFISVGFVQGLLNWLLAIGMRFAVQAAEDDRDIVHIESRQLQIGITLSIAALGLFLLSFYNQHLDFKGNYLHVLGRLCYLFFQKYLTPASSWWPPQPIPLLMLPIVVMALVAFGQAFVTTPLDPAFRGWDKDRNGSLDKSEFRRAVQSTGLVTSSKALDRIFDAWDEDKSGSIDLSEMDKLLQSLKMNRDLAKRIYKG